MADELTGPRDSADPKPALPLVVSVNDGRGAAWLRLGLLAIFLGVLVFLPIALAVVSFSEPPAPWKARACLDLAILVMILAIPSGLIWLALRPRRWIIAEEEITRVGPTGRRRMLRWSEVQRVEGGMKLHGPRGTGRIHVPLPSLPEPTRNAARAALRERLAPYFTFPEPLVVTGTQVIGGILLAMLATLPAILWMAWPWFGKRSRNQRLRPGPVSLPRGLRGAVEWTSRRWGRRYPIRTLVICGVLLGVWVFVPPMAWMGLLCWLLVRRLPRPERITRRELPGPTRGPGS